MRPAPWSACPRKAREASAAHGVVDAEAVAAALSARLGIPVEKLSEDDLAKLAGLEDFLNGRIFGQPAAMRQIASAVQKASAGLGDPNGPRHVFALFGSTGVGKTAAAQALAEFLFEFAGCVDPPGHGGV